ncbi:6349_t:CDS:2, partial [Acaulospora colombiana]
YWVDRYPHWVIMNFGGEFESYRKVEENLNSLRRVCRLWDEYLRKYIHRFVRMSDVMHGKVPVHDLQSAPQEALLDEIVANSVDSYLEYLEYCYETLTQQQLPKVEVLDLYVTEYIDAFISPQIFPNLACITDHECIHSVSLDITTSFTDLRYLYLRSRFDNEAYRSATLTTLTLSFILPDPSFASVLDNVDLPALRNLWVLDSLYEQLDTYDEPPWLLLLTAIGKELQRVRLPEDEEE